MKNATVEESLKEHPALEYTVSFMFNHWKIDLLGCVSLGTRAIPSESTIVYSYIIRFHPTVIRDIESLRNELHLNKLVKYSRNLVAGSSFKKWDKEYPILVDRVNTLAEKYGLNPLNWHVSLMVYVFTNVLPVPFGTEKILFSPLPSFQHARSANNKANLSELEINVYGEYFLRKKKYPVLVFLEQINTKNELIKWVEDNWDKTLRASLSSLPERFFNQVDVDKFTFEIPIWSMRRSGKS